MNTVTWLVVGMFLVFGTTVRDKGPVRTPAHSVHDISRQLINKAERGLKEGDLVVRLSRDPVSQLIRQINTDDKSYSHAGLVVMRGGKPMILHSVSGTENPAGGLIAVPLPRFADPGEHYGFGVFRYDFSPEEMKRLADTLSAWEFKQIGFDSVFNLRSNNRMYCSELVMKAVQSATGNRLRFHPVLLEAWQSKLLSAHMGQPLPKKMAVIPIDALYRNPFCSEVNRISFAD